MGCCEKRNSAAKEGTAMSDNERSSIKTQESPGPEFITLDEAAAMTTGTRVTFIPGIPAMYSEALKNICFVKGVPLIRALHPFMGIDKATGKDRQARLYELTSQTSLPTMFHEQERPRNAWIEQLALAEQIGKAGTPLLIPSDFELRVEVFGLCAVILAEDGFVWNTRLLADSPLGRKYGFTEEASAAAPSKIAEAITLIDRRLEAQEQRGSRYLVGDALTAADIYWATLSMMVLSAPPQIMPRTRQNNGMLKYFAMNSQNPAIADALTKRIEDHQRFILTTYCETPAVLGGDPL
jgi:glutathione S-transferase